MTIQVVSCLTASLEKKIEHVIGCAIRVHKALGPGFLEPVYRNALCIELETANLSFQREKTIAVLYRNIPVGHYRIDLVVADEIVVELKAVTCIEQVHTAQVLSYLRAAKLQVGLLMNFNAPTLPAGLRRIVL